MIEKDNQTINNLVDKLISYNLKSSSKFSKIVSYINNKVKIF